MHIMHSKETAVFLNELFYGVSLAQEHVGHVKAQGFQDRQLWIELRLRKAVWKWAMA